MTTPESRMQEMRDAFQQEYARRYKYSVPEIFAMRDGKYIVYSVECAWGMWQAAWSARTMPVEAITEHLYNWMVGVMPNGDLLNAAVVCDHAGIVGFKRAFAKELSAALTQLLEQGRD